MMMFSQKKANPNFEFKTSCNLIDRQRLSKSFSETQIIYIPVIASKILKSKDDFDLPLKGIALGNGVTDPMSYLPEIASTAYNLGLIDYTER